MSDNDRSVSRSPSQDGDREKSEPPAAEVAEEFKLFIGGISWHMDDRELKDSELLDLLEPAKQGLFHGSYKRASHFDSPIVH